MKNNPFLTSFGNASDEAYINRYSEEDIIIDDFNRELSSSQVYMLAGVRGIGKTALTTYITENIAKDSKEWKVVNLSSQSNLLKTLAANLQADPILGKVFIEKKLDFSLLGIGVSIEGGTKISDEEVMIRQMLKVMKGIKKKLLVTVDEVSNTENIRKFTSSFQLYTRERLPIYLIMTGLYKDIKSLQTHKNMTFLKRAPRINLGPLDLNMIAKRYASIFDISFEDAAKMAKITKGYSYAYSLLGNIYWEKRDSLSLDDMIIQLKDILEDRVYSQVWAELTGAEKEFIKAMNNCIEDNNQKAKVGDVVNLLQKAPAQVNEYKSRLVETGIIDAGERGYIEYSLPFFGETVDRLTIIEL
ncbi:MAG: ATP-binding protein [Lachnospiraceae bacterium]|nr:ATP-binding protein [Lachnospiraceae bacterium]